MNNSIENNKQTLSDEELSGVTGGKIDLPPTFFDKCEDQKNEFDCISVEHCRWESAGKSHKCNFHGELKKR